MKTKQMNFNFIVPIYNVRVHVFIGSGTVGKIKNLTGENLETENFLGMIITNDDKGNYILFVADHKDSTEFINTLSHEVCHLVFHILKDKGHASNMSSDENETEAYLTGWITGYIFKKMRTKGMRI